MLPIGAYVGEQQLLDGRAAVVVGGTRGIGRAMAESLARHGAGVVVNGRDAEAARGAAAAISGAGQLNEATMRGSLDAAPAEYVAPMYAGIWSVISRRT
jgi:NAD(P)-dependent dehydrogenase (short-subunit alcohol dehydrogenase family)